MITKERLIEIEQAARLFGPANCWTGTSGMLAEMIIELLREVEYLQSLLNMIDSVSKAIDDELQ